MPRQRTDEATRDDKASEMDSDDASSNTSMSADEGERESSQNRVANEEEQQEEAEGLNCSLVLADTRRCSGQLTASPKGLHFSSRADPGHVFGAALLGVIIFFFGPKPLAAARRHHSSLFTQSLSIQTYHMTGFDGLAGGLPNKEAGERTEATSTSSFTAQCLTCPAHLAVSANKSARPGDQRRAMKRNIRLCILLLADHGHSAIPD